MSNITELEQRVRHWADMAALTSERASCLSVEQLEEIANALASRTVKIPYLPDDCDRTEAHYKYQAALRDAGIKVEAE